MASLYNYKWQQYRLKFLAENPYCKRHLELKKFVKATIVDHKIPHKGNLELFWDENNHQGLCKACHDSFKQRYEKSGTIAGCDINGLPLDPMHHWFKKAKNGTH